MISSRPSSHLVQPSQLLSELKRSGEVVPSELICEIELTRFDASERDALLPLLRRYIMANRNSNNRDTLIAVAAAVRKYIALMPMERMGELTELLEAGNRASPRKELVIEVAKMIYRDFEVHPPARPDSQPALAQRLWERACAYANPHVLMEDKFSAAASTCIEAIIAMRSELAQQAWELAATSPYRWFAQLVHDDLQELRARWSMKNGEAASWLAELLNRVPVQT